MTGCKNMRKKFKKQREIAVKLTDIVKIYYIKTEKPTLVETILNKNNITKHSALNSVSLTVLKGEKIGIIGANGAGKTTLLKIIVGITQPQSGSVMVNGKVVSLINLMAGFHSEMTGYENIKLNGLLIGMSSNEIELKKKNIIRFADIGNFIHAPLHTYSSGMKLRLGFSIAVHADPDILILDEGVSAGDEKFRVKANSRIQKLFKKNKTIIVVSHWLNFLKENCNRIIWIDKGTIKEDGSTKILDKYLNYYTSKNKK